MPSTERHAINVAASVVADLSAGIYRTPAGALKELISNAFDADARTVHISSDPPHYATLTCSDDGVGITPKRFKTILSLIGGSSKRDDGELSQELGRPLIGRIGIGILSIGQICQSFEVYSSAKGDREKLRACIDLEPYMRPEAKRIQLGQSLEDQPDVQVGQYEIETAPEKKSAHYTRVVMRNVIPAFRDKLANGPMTEGAGVTPTSFKKGSMQEFAPHRQQRQGSGAWSLRSAYLGVSQHRAGQVHGRWTGARYRSQGPAPEAGELSVSSVR